MVGFLVLLLPILMVSCALVQKVAIIGCGTGGLTLGLSLTKMCPSVEVTMFDARAAFLDAEVGGGVQISAGAAILKLLQTPRHISQYGLPLQSVLARNENQETLLSFDLPSLVAYTIMRNTLVRLLHDSIVNNVAMDKNQSPIVTFKTGKCCADILENQTTQKVAVVFEDGSLEDGFDVVVGADGLGSTVRNVVLSHKRTGVLYPTNGIAAERTGLRITYCVTPVDNATQPALRKNNRNALHQWFGDGTYALAGSYGAENGIQHMLAVVYRSRETSPFGVNPKWDPSNGSTDEVLQRLWRAGLGGNAELLSILEASAQQGGRTIDLSVRDSIVPLSTWSSQSGRVILLGDSAHAMSPFLGQGANQAMQDAYCLASLIRDRNMQCNAPSSAQRPSESLKKMALKYEAIRKLPTALLSVESRFLGELETLNGPIGRVVKENFFRAMSHTGIAKMVYLMGTVPKVT